MLSVSPFASLRHRNFRLFFAGQSTSLIGTWMQSVAQGWLVLELTNSAFWVGLVTALSALPVLLFSLPAGVYVDRANKHRIILVCQVLMALAAALLAGLTFLGRIEPWEVAALAAVVGCLSAIEIPARQSFIVDLVGKEDLTNAIALNSSAYNATRILGPIAAGLIIAATNIGFCFAVNAVSKAAVVAGLAAMKLPPFRPPLLPGNARELLREGLRFARRDRGVWALMVMTAIFSIFGFQFSVLLPVFARDVLQVGAEGLGVMSAAVGIGAMSAALIVAAFSGRIRRGVMVRWSGPAFGLSVAAFALLRWYPAVLLMLLLAGFFMVGNNAATNTLLQGMVPDELRGRIMSLWTFLFVGFAPIGSLQAGWLADYVGAPWSVAVGGLISAVASYWMWWRYAPEVSELR